MQSKNGRFLSFSLLLFFLKQGDILGYAIQTSILFKGTVKKEIKQKNRTDNHVVQPQSILYAFQLKVILSTFTLLTS